MFAERSDNLPILCYSRSSLPVNFAQRTTFVRIRARTPQSPRLINSDLMFDTARSPSVETPLSHPFGQRKSCLEIEVASYFAILCLIRIFSVFIRNRPTFCSHQQYFRESATTVEMWRECRRVLSKRQRSRKSRAQISEATYSCSLRPLFDSEACRDQETILSSRSSHPKSYKINDEIDRRGLGSLRVRRRLRRWVNMGLRTSILRSGELTRETGTVSRKEGSLQLITLETSFRLTLPFQQSFLLGNRYILALHVEPAS